MKKLLFTLLIFVLSFSNLSAETNIKRIYEGKLDSKITILVFESLTCSHCATFHKEIYPKIKKNFIDKGLVKLEYRNFPLDLAAFNAAKVAHCRVSNGEEILHFLYQNQNATGWWSDSELPALTGLALVALEMADIKNLSAKYESERRRAYDYLASFIT